MNIIKRILYWLNPPNKKEDKPNIELLLNEITPQGSRTMWEVSIMVNGALRTKEYFKRKPTKRKLQEIIDNHR